jgi:FixJ family two-component response regulator
MKSLGYTAQTFASAEEFLNSCQVARTSCLIADVQMRGMTGLELHRHLVASGKTIPTILVTAYPDDTVRKRALEDGVVCYLSKPFDENDLFACIGLSLKDGLTKANMGAIGAIMKYGSEPQKRLAAGRAPGPPLAQGRRYLQ